MAPGNISCPHRFWSSTLGCDMLLRLLLLLCLLTSACSLPVLTQTQTVVRLSLDRSSKRLYHQMHEFGIKN